MDRSDDGGLTMNEMTATIEIQAEIIAKLRREKVHLAETAAQQVKALTDRIAELEALIPPKDQQ